MTQSEKDARSCCSIQKQELMEDIRQCDMCSSSWEDHHRCLLRAAKESGRRSRNCLVA